MGEWEGAIVAPPSPEHIACCGGAPVPPQLHPGCAKFWRRRQCVGVVGAGSVGVGVGCWLLTKRGLLRARGQGFVCVSVELVTGEQLSCGLNIHTRECVQEYTHAH